jgi:hypothetical protein
MYWGALVKSVEASTRRSSGVIPSGDESALGSITKAETRSAVQGAVAWQGELN